MTINSKPCTFSRYLFCATIVYIRFLLFGPQPTLPRFRFSFVPLVDLHINLIVILCQLIQHESPLHFIMVFLLQALRDPEISRIYSKNILLVTAVDNGFIDNAQKSKNFIVYHIFIYVYYYNIFILFIIIYFMLLILSPYFHSHFTIQYLSTKMEDAVFGET